MASPGRELEFENSPHIVGQYLLLLPVDCCKTEHNAVFYRHQSTVACGRISYGGSSYSGDRSAIAIVPISGR